MDWVVETALPQELRKLASAIEEKDNQIQALEHTNEKHQQSIEQKDTTIALLNDNLKNREHDKGMHIKNSYKNVKASLPILRNVMFLM